jgi:uncharacterized protein (TIGR03067 family)
MKTFAVALVVGLVAVPAARADEKPDLTGKYTLVGGKKNGKDLDEVAKKATYTATADQFVITGGDVKFVISYKLDAAATPVRIHMAYIEGPEGTKGLTASGIVELKGDTLKIAYALGKDKQPTDFEGKTGYLIELKKMK